jgi:cyclophilin family peptidyl-prolyl cis-trans isomerase
MTRLALLSAALLFAAPALAQLPGEAAPKATPSPAATIVAASPSLPAVDSENILYLDLSTGGRVAIMLRPQAAPQHVERIKSLVRKGFYDGVVFHRVIDGFMAQTGDPKGTGQGGSDLPDLKAEFNELPHVRGAVSMARTQEPDSANSQFFIMFQPLLRLDRTYTVFGRVISGMQWVDPIERGEPPANPSRVLQASIAADNKPPPAFPAPKSAPDPVAEEAAKLLKSVPAAPPPRP